MRSTLMTGREKWKWKEIQPGVTVCESSGWKKQVYGGKKNTHWGQKQIYWIIGKTVLKVSDNLMASVNRCFKLKCGHILKFLWVTIVQLAGNKSMHNCILCTQRKYLEEQRFSLTNSSLLCYRNEYKFRPESKPTLNLCWLVHIASSYVPIKFKSGHLQFHGQPALCISSLL